MITVEPTTESVNPLLPVKDLFLAARKTAKTNFPFGRCDVMFNNMHIEQDATPVGLDMRPGDNVLLYPTFGKFEGQDQIKDHLCYDVLHDRNRPGLNFSIGVTEGGLPLVDCQTKKLLVNVAVDCFKKASFYVGPIRNSTHENAETAPPIVQLVPKNRESTVDELLYAWHSYSYAASIGVGGVNFKPKGLPTFLWYRDKKIVMGKKTKIEDVIDERMQRHYFYLPPPYSQDEGQRRTEATSTCPVSDERSIDKLLEFIELDEDDDHASGTKRKKKKKKKGPRKEMTESVHTDQQQV